MTVDFIREYEWKKYPDKMIKSLDRTKALAATERNGQAAGAFFMLQEGVGENGFSLPD